MARLSADEQVAMNKRILAAIGTGKKGKTKTELLAATSLEPKTLTSQLVRMKRAKLINSVIGEGGPRGAHWVRI